MLPVVILIIVASFLGEGMVSANLCTTQNIDVATRIVFGEARGESNRGKLAVAYSLVNRVNHAGFPNDFMAVAYQRTTDGKYQYETLDLPSHDRSFSDHKSRNTPEYRDSRTAASDGLCRRRSDPTGCATNYCAYDPCAATNSNRYWIAYNKMQIGGHYFVCLRPR